MAGRGAAVTNPGAPPRRLSALFRALFKGPVGQAACDDLDAEYGATRASRGAVVAWLRYAGHLLTPSTWALALALHRITVRPHGGLDIRHTLRSFRRTPAFTVTVLLTLSLGIGANVAMLGIVDRLYFRPVSMMRDPGTVHRVYLQRSTAQARRLTHQSMSYGQYLDLRRATDVFSAWAVFSERLLPVGSGSAARERHVSAVTASYFDFFEAAPARGRFFAPDEDVPPAGAPVAVLSYRFWQDEFGGRDVLGDALDVGSLRATVIGVAPEGFVGIDDVNPPSVFIPVASLALALDLADDPAFYGYYRFGWANVLTRRAPGVTPEQASAALERAYRISWEQERATAPERVLPIERAQPSALAGPVRRAAGPAALPETQVALWAAGLSVLVLLVACANIASLWLARGLQRQREICIRLAIGASRSRLAGQAITESLLLALMASAGAALVTYWAGPALFGLLIPQEAANLAVFDSRIALLTLAVAFSVGLVTGLAPALFAAHGDPGRALGSRVPPGAAQGRRLRAALVVGQGAFSVALLIGTLLFLRSVAAIEAVPLGFDAGRVLIVDPLERREPLPPEQHAGLRARLLLEAERLPRVEAASWVSAAPLWRSGRQRLFVQGVPSVGALGAFVTYAVDARYFDVMGTKILRGRRLMASDRAGTPLAAVVSAGMARALWPGEEAIGQCVRVGTEQAPCTTVVGIAEDVLQSQQYAQDTPQFQYYLPLEQAPIDYVGFLLLKVDGDAREHVEAVRQPLQVHMPGDAYVNVEPMGRLLANVQRPWRLGATLFLLFGVLALAVAVLGFHGVISYNMAQRSQELALRSALGADGHDLVRLVAGQAMPLAAGAIAGGTVIAGIAGSRLQALLYGQSAHDPAVYLSVGAFMLIVAVGASLPAAVRAAKIDPTLALRS